MAVYSDTWHEPYKFSEAKAYPPSSSTMSQAMNVAGLLVNVPSLVEVCINLGDFLWDKIKAYHGCGERANNLATRFDIMWNSYKDIIKMVERIEADLEEEMKLEIWKILTRLRDILHNAINKLSRLGVQFGTPPTRRQAFIFSTLAENELEEMMKKAELWYEIILKRLAVINLTQPGVFNRIVTLLPPSPSLKYRANERQYQIPLNEVILDRRPTQNLKRLSSSYVYRSTSNPNILIEYRYYDRSIVGDAFIEYSNNVYGMVRMLKSADSRLMSILKCSGVYPVANEAEPRFELQYSIPAGFDYPRSLRDLLTDRTMEAIHPLNHRFRLANQLASSILYMHGGEFVHKAIKPENILVMVPAQAGPREQFPYVLGWPFLVGFDRCRPASMLSGRYGEGRLEDCLYQHVSRWGVVAEEAFSMSHDIYSLGVVLLEIGLWQPLVEWSIESERYIFADFLLDVINPGVSGDSRITKADRRSAMIMKRLLEVAKVELPPRMGEIYAGVVVACLEVLDGGMVKLENFERLSDRLVEPAYIKYVVSRLENLKV